MKMRILIFMFLASLVMALGANAQGVQIPNTFPRQPAAALKALKGTKGKPFYKGWVFIDGKYIPPPYTVARFGTTLRINNYQVTGELIPWNEFIKTQSGVKVTKSVNDPNAGGESSEPEAEPEPELDMDDAWESSLDDLFDDEPAAKKSSSSSSSYKPRPKKPTVKVTYSFDGEFQPNEKTKAYVAKINKERDRVEQILRNGGMCCFSSRYSKIMLEGIVAKAIMEKLPAMMKKSTSANELSQEVRSAGFVYFHDLFVGQLFKNRLDYQVLTQRVESEKK
ncbi:MAG: hypothetical protein IJQ34_08260 [Kiritimatiellae bacterium]|nr:hypothetical protein [Kiritimatiellia bacterium]